MTRSSLGKKLFDSTNIPNYHPVLGGAGAPQKLLSPVQPLRKLSLAGGMLVRHPKKEKP